MLHNTKPTKSTFSPPPERRGLRRAEAAQYIGVSSSKFDELVQDGRMPNPKKIDGRRVWDRISVDQKFDALDAEHEATKNPWDA
ncbi:MAG: hypothetical protein AAGF27_03050 [Pseudomonadota bacterium]